MRTHIVSALAIVGAASGAFAQSGRYYVTDESGFNKVWQFQGGALVASFPTVPGGGADGPIIVDGNTNTIRSVKGGFTGGAAPSPGSEYNFAGTPLGGVSLNFSAHVGAGRVIDAAFDGQYSYILSGLFGTSGVYRYNADFSGPGTLMFTLPTSPQNTAQGITCQGSHVWISDYDFAAVAGRVREYDFAGNELFSFPVFDNNGVGSERNTALAFDDSDQTFWMNAHVENTLGFGIGELWQFSKTGTFLQKIHAQQSDPNAPANILYWGGEIFTIPAPGTVALLGLGGLVALRRRR